MGHLSGQSPLALLLVLAIYTVASQAAPSKNYCDTTISLTTTTPCFSCNLPQLWPCPYGYLRKNQSPPQRNCRYLALGISLPGCSVECVKEVPYPECCPGYWGRDCIECPETAENPCSSNGNCSDGIVGNGTCSCKPGYMGTACEDCAPNLYGPSCSLKCRCVHGLCNSGIKGDGTCTCFSGYRGSSCDLELPDCSALKCGPEARCVEQATTGKLECQCKPGYYGNGLQCTSINPCLSKVCHEKAVCSHVGPNQYKCECMAGYEGDGTVCMPMDPCQKDNGGCSALSTRCVYDGPGKSHCVCRPGYINLNKDSCTVVNKCKPDSCHKNAQCTMGDDAEIQCTCKSGYVGDGRTCYGTILERLKELNARPDSQWLGLLSNAITLFESVVTWPLSSLGPFTVFVPTNKGFGQDAKKLSSLLADKNQALYLTKLHMLAGERAGDDLQGSVVTLTGRQGAIIKEDNQKKYKINGSRRKGIILESGLVASNGIIHIISKLMDTVPPAVRSQREEKLSKILSDNSKFSSFKSFLEKTSLKVELDGDGPFTLFAPTNVAFAFMPSGYLEFLKSEEGANKLLEVLRHHVVSSKVEVFNIASLTSLETKANQILTINSTQEGQILINGARILEADVEAKNGRLYSISTVLIPPTVEPMLPHRCDQTTFTTTQGTCVSCIKPSLSQCPSGESMGRYYSGCVIDAVLGLGCYVMCNVTVTTPSCCPGFYGPDCRPCPGGYTQPCLGIGKCNDGMDGNGTCSCEPAFAGNQCQYCSNPNKYGQDCSRSCLCVKGTCDNRRTSEGACRTYPPCQEGFMGEYCERQLNACGPIPYCHAHASCDFNIRPVQCVCNPGYQGNGITCVESDPCALPDRGGCGPNTKCVKTGPGTHSCQCLTGWRMDGEECQPVDNCLDPSRGNCHPNATCIYIGPGQSDCTCKTGYHGNGFSCEPMSPCVSLHLHCHFLANCLYEKSQWMCVCQEGLSGDGIQCYGTLSQVLSSEPIMSEFNQWIQDQVIRELLSDQDNITVFVPSPSAIKLMNNQDREFWLTADNLPSLVRGHLAKGLYVLSDLKAPDLSLHSLLNSQLPITWTNETAVVRGAKILSPDHPAWNGVIHIIDKVLVPGRNESLGLLEVLDHTQELSLFRQSLIAHNLTSKTIDEASAYTMFAPTDTAIQAFLGTSGNTTLDLNVTKYHIILEEKLLAAELQDGLYKETMLGISYQINILHRDGKLLVNNKALIGMTDIRVGKGVIHTLNAVLSIPRNRCDKITTTNIWGKCMDCRTERSSRCPPGTKATDLKWSKAFTGRVCLYRSPLGGFHTIGCKTRCINHTIERRCCSGYYGNKCEPCPGSEGKPCGGEKGVCNDDVAGNGVCQCKAGYKGTACELCYPNKYGIHCDQECKCMHGSCSDGPDGDGSCKCPVGWRGTTCSEVMRPDDCAGKCHTSANCVEDKQNGDGKYSCKCADGFEGNGFNCTAVNACEKTNGGCSANALCKRTTAGQRDCVCNQGYSGDGIVCIEINPCLEGGGGCDTNAECVHTGPNKSSCVCRKRFSGDGRTCTAINPCKKKNGGCHTDAKCVMTSPGERNCTCNNGFMGDGLICRGNLNVEIAEISPSIYRGLRLGKVHDLSGPGPFTVFVPAKDVVVKEMARFGSWLKDKGILGRVIRYHIVPCSKLQPEQLKSTTSLTTLMGDRLSLSYDHKNDTVFVNNLTVSSSSEATNGIIYLIDSFLVPPSLDQKPVNYTMVSELRDYSTFAKLLEDTGVSTFLNDPLHQPLSVFLPSDQVMGALPQERRDFLYAEHNRPYLLEYLHYHILPHVQASLSTLKDTTITTFQGSELQINCAGEGRVGQMFVSSDPNCVVRSKALSFPWGKAYGIECLLSPPSLGGRCDTMDQIEIMMPCGSCLDQTPCPGKARLKETLKCSDVPGVYLRRTACQPVCIMPLWQRKCCPGYYGRDCLACPGGAETPCKNHGKCDAGSLGNGTCTCDKGFTGSACELCEEGHFGANCKACNCTENGACSQGRSGDGSCFCNEGWVGQRCEAKQGSIPVCNPICHSQALCQENNTCVCKPFYEGDGIICTETDLCQFWNGGCYKGGKCSMRKGKVSCTCPAFHKGDGFDCTPIDPCEGNDNGGCHEHATCKMTAPGKKRCECKSNYIGDGVMCELRETPLNRCLQGNGQCHPDAQCNDLHFEDKTAGVYHYRSPKGQYKLNYTEAQAACTMDGATLATYTQLSYAQQAGMNLCAAGWLSGSRVGYPTTHPNPKCGFGHVGIVDYGVRSNLSETWDTFCYRVQDVKCVCKQGYIGSGYSCTGNILQVLWSQPRFSNFLAQILGYSESSTSGREYMKRLSNGTLQSTLFVTDNNGLAPNQTLSSRDLEFHLSDVQAFSLEQLTNGSHIRTRLGQPLTVIGVPDINNPSKLTASRYISDCFLIESDILASNGIIHVLERPLTAPPPKPASHVGHQAGMGIGVILLLLLIAAILFVGYHFYTHKTKPFSFHYFKEDEGEDSLEEPNICNPMYDNVSDPSPPPALESQPDPAEDTHQIVSIDSNNILES